MLQFAAVCRSIQRHAEYTNMRLQDARQRTAQRGTVTQRNAPHRIRCEQITFTLHQKRSGTGVLCKQKNKSSSPLTQQLLRKINGYFIRLLTWKQS